MRQQDSAAAQRELDGGCKCGWRGKIPTELMLNMADQKLLCPACYAEFRAWPPVAPLST